MVVHGCLKKIKPGINAFSFIHVETPWVSIKKRRSITTHKTIRHRCRVRFYAFEKKFVETAVNLPDDVILNAFLLCHGPENLLFSLHYIYLEKTILSLAKKDK